MRIKIITPNQYGRIEFSKEELEKILSEAYNEGYSDGKNCQFNRGVYVDNLINYTATASCTSGSCTNSNLTTIDGETYSSTDTTLATITNLDLK